MSEIISITADRESVCMADDIKSHRKPFEFPADLQMHQLIEELQKDEEYKGCSGGIWAGSPYKYKCLRSNDGKWKTNMPISAKKFFSDIEPYLCFERQSKKCE